MNYMDLHWAQHKKVLEVSKCWTNEPPAIRNQENVADVHAICWISLEDLNSSNAVEGARHGSISCFMSKASERFRAKGNEGNGHFFSLKKKKPKISILTLLPNSSLFYKNPLLIAGKAMASE